jgi:GT2 family glycosyltransferase
MKLSIVIASYNRAQGLVAFLCELSRQRVTNGVEWEAVIVDNNSSDGTRLAIAPLLSAHPQKFKYLFEGRQGKSLALNAGIAEAKGEVFVFTDDDCVPDPDWLAAIAREFSADPSLGALGGRVELFSEEDRPVSIRTSRERTLVSSRDQLLSLLIGCNMAIRRSALEVVGGFDPFLGPGTRLPAMEDLDLLYRIFRKGLKIIYSPDALVLHNHGRTSDEQIQALNRGYVVGRGAFYCKHVLTGDVDVLRMAYWEVSSLARKLLKTFFTTEKQNGQAGFLWALFVGGVRRLVWNQTVRKA